MRNLLSIDLFIRTSTIHQNHDISYQHFGPLVCAADAIFTANLLVFWLILFVSLIISFFLITNEYRSCVFLTYENKMSFLRSDNNGDRTE